MMIRAWVFGLVGLLAVLVLAGCDAELVFDPQRSARATAVSDSYGEATLRYPYTGSSETVVVRDSASDARLPGIQVLGLTEGGRSLYVAADPQYLRHPAITSGEPSSSFASRIYLTPADRQLGVNATSYHPVDGGLLRRLASDYGTSRLTTVGGLRDQLASLASGMNAGLVVCIHEPLTSLTAETTAVQVAQRTSNLSSAFQAIGWQHIYTSRGFTTGQQVRLWVVDPYALRVSGVSGSAGALRGTLLAIVAPTSSSTGSVLPRSLRIELTWDAPVDLDLHLIRNGAPVYDDRDDCFWRYLEQNWGDPYRVTDNPRLLYDNQSGYGPETILLDEMRAGDYYTVVVDYWGNGSGGASYTPVTATLRVWTGNAATPTVLTVTGMTYGTPWRGDYKAVCDIDGATGQVIPNTRAVERNMTRATGGKGGQ